MIFTRTIMLHLKKMYDFSKKIKTKLRMENSGA